MQKIMIFLICSMFFLPTLIVQASEQQSNDDMSWEISVLPKASIEELAAKRWSVILENDLGIYGYDMNSLNFLESTTGIFDKNIVNVLVKTVFTDKETLKNLNKIYAKKLTKKEKAQHCEMQLRFNLSEKTYGVEFMDVYGSKGTKLETKKALLNMIPIPEKTFASVMFEICLQATEEEKQ